MKLLRVNMKQLQVRWEPVPESMNSLGGRALIAKLLLEEIPPTCDALGPHNKLIFTPGLLGGAGVSTAGRLSVGSKSPLTGGVKEANAGGTAGDTLGKLGIKAIVIEGQAEPGRAVSVTRDGRFRPNCCPRIICVVWAHMPPRTGLQEQYGSRLHSHFVSVKPASI